MEILDILIRIYYEVKTQSPVIQVIIFSIIFCFFVTVFLISYLSVMRYLHNKKRDKLADIEPKLRSIFEDILFNERKFNDIEIVHRYNNVVKKETFDIIELSLDILLEFKFESVKESDRYNQIVKALDFENHIQKKLSFSFDHTKMKALQQLQILEIRNLNPKILPHAYSKNLELRREARLSHLHLNDNNPYRFLDEIKGELTPWDEIKLHKLLKKQHEKDNLVNLSKWINYSQNDSLVIFLIKAAGYFNQKEAKEVIYERSKSPNTRVRCAAFVTLGLINAKEYEPELRQRFFLEPDMCQYSIINAIGQLNSGKSASFLKKAYKKAKSFSLKKDIALTIFNYNSLNYSLFEELKITQNEDKDKQIFSHIEDSLIKFK